MMIWIMNQTQIKILLTEFPGATRKILMQLGLERNYGCNLDAALTGIVKNGTVRYELGDVEGSGPRPRKYYLV